jgi:hypothetical protein
MKRVWQGVAFGNTCSLELDAGKLRAYRLDGVRPHEIPQYLPQIMHTAVVDMAMRLEKIADVVKGEM